MKGSWNTNMLQHDKSFISFYLILKRYRCVCHLLNKKWKNPTPQKTNPENKTIRPCLVQLGIQYVLCRGNQRTTCVCVCIYRDSFVSDKRTESRVQSWLITCCGNDCFGRLPWKMIQIGSVVLDSCKTCKTRLWPLWEWNANYLWQVMVTVAWIL